MSFVLTKDQIFTSRSSSSHEWIIRENNLCDSAGGQITLVRVEITPGKKWANLDSWNYKVDQDIFPKWYDAEDCEMRTRKELKRIAKTWPWLSELSAFIKSLPKVKWLKQHTKPLKDWKYFERESAVAARAAAWAAAWDAARAAAGDAAWAAARAAALKSYVILAGKNLAENHKKHIEDRWRVWTKGYALYCDVNGVLYVYGVKK